MKKTKVLLLPAVLFAACLALFACSTEDSTDDDGQISSSSGGNGGDSSSSGSGDDDDSSSSGDGASSSSGDSSSSGGATANVESVTIGEQVWMAKNLDVTGGICYGAYGGRWEYDPEDIYFYGDGEYVLFTQAEATANCSKYGKLYDWETAKTACPSGWRLPNNDDWQELIAYISEESQDEEDCYGECTGKYLKAEDGWKSGEGYYGSYYGNGIDVYGFKALPGGYGMPSSGEDEEAPFDGLGGAGNWWSYTEDDDDYAFSFSVSSPYDEADLGYSYKENFLSIRCIKE